MASAKRSAKDAAKVSDAPFRLAKYRAKRRFEVTPEPPPPPLGSSQTHAFPEKKKAFVVQKHDARRLHYDVRLEVDGAMVSWAVPKGPSFDPAVRRLAVQTEDHPLEYNAFEGRIPDGEYGAGDVLIWDRGTYETVPPGSERAMLEKGHLHVRLSGEKLEGDWHLVRTGRSGSRDGAEKAQWLMFKAKDGHANPAFDVVTERPESVVSGKQATRGPRRSAQSASGRNAQTLLEAVGEPELATAVASLPRPEQWSFEVKYDGYRLFVCKAGPEVRLTTRRANDWTARFAPIAEAAAKLPAVECVVDGEACAVDEEGRPSFGALQEWLAGGAKTARLAYAAFDLLWLDGRDLRGEPLETRRELLQALFVEQAGPLSVSRAVEGDLEALLRAAKAAGLEGLVGKRKGSPYVAGRTGAWIKLRFDRRQDCAVVGWIPLSGQTGEVGALLLAVAEGGELVFAGRVGTGFSAQARRELPLRLGPVQDSVPEVKGAPRVKDARWVEPRWVAECAFSEWTREGSMRQPRFLRIRDDKGPLDCVREGPAASVLAPAPVDEVPPLANAPAFRDAPKLSNPAKVLFPRDGIAKRAIWDYLTAIAPHMLPHLAGRPLTLQRYPDGIDGEEWYQQNAPNKTPDYVRLIEVNPRHGAKQRIACDNVETLQWLANLAALTMHQWVSHVPSGVSQRAAVDDALAQPDYVVLDLDPGAGTWADLVDVATAVHRLLDALSLESFPKTSGKRGVHIVVPIAKGATHDEATGFAEKIARAVAKVLPAIATVERMKDKRGGRLYVDFGQNGEGRTIVSPYAIRARDGAVVSTPIAWGELTETLDPTSFTIRTVLARVDKHGDLFAGVLRGTKPLPRV